MPNPCAPFVIGVTIRATRQRAYNSRSYQRAKARETPEQRAARLAALKKRRDALRKNPEHAAREKARLAAYRESHRGEIRAKQNDKNARHAARQKKQRPAQLRIAGFAVITKDELLHDHTRWRGPGMWREIDLEAQADQILRAAKKGGPP